MIKIMQKRIFKRDGTFKIILYIQSLTTFHHLQGNGLCLSPIVSLTCIPATAPSALPPLFHAAAREVLQKCKSDHDPPLFRPYKASHSSLNKSKILTLYHLPGCRMSHVISCSHLFRSLPHCCHSSHTGLLAIFQTLVPALGPLHLPVPPSGMR